MPLLGPAAMLLGFDVADAEIAEHDRWHTHEHLPERLAIPGFLRGTRWVARDVRAPQRYAVLYEVQALGVLTSDAYLARLNQPTPWTTRVMPHYRGMTRGLCTVRASCGYGLGHAALLLRFRTPPSPALERWLADELLPSLPSGAGLASAHWLEGAAAAPMTNEQRLRGPDGAIGSALLLTGYDADAVDAQAPIAGRLAALGATDVRAGGYRIDVTLTADERERSAGTGVRRA